MKDTYRLQLPTEFDTVAKWAWQLMYELGSGLFAHKDTLVVTNDGYDITDPAWVGKSYSELENWLIQQFQGWVAEGPTGPMWGVIAQGLIRPTF